MISWFSCEYQPKFYRSSKRVKAIVFGFDFNLLISNPNAQSEVNFLRDQRFWWGHESNILIERSPFQMINHGGSRTCTCTHNWLVHQFEYNFNPSRWIFIITLRIWRSKLIPILHFALVKVISISNYKYWRSAKDKLQIYILSFSFLFPLLYVMYFFLGNLTTHFAVGEMCSPIYVK